MHTDVLGIKWWCLQSMIMYKQKCPAIYRLYHHSTYALFLYAYFRAGRKCQFGFILGVHCQSYTVRLHIRADFIFPVSSPLGHDKRISSSGSRLPFRMSVHDFSNERKRACWDCWVTWRYKNRASRSDFQYLSFSASPPWKLQPVKAWEERLRRWSGKITSSKIAPEITRVEHR